MADRLVGKSTGGADFKPHSAGSHAMVCVDVVDLGKKVQAFQGHDPRIVNECALVFASGERDERGELVLVNSYYTLSMHEKAKLRQHLESWRGRPYSEREARDGVPLDKLEGVPALVMVSHRQSAKGRTYAVIDAIGPLARGMSAPDVTGYKRPAFFADRKSDNALSVRAFALTDEPPVPDDRFAPGEADSQATDLPF